MHLILCTPAPRPHKSRGSRQAGRLARARGVQVGLSGAARHACTARDQLVLAYPDLGSVVLRQLLDAVPDVLDVVRVREHRLEHVAETGSVYGSLVHDHGCICQVPGICIRMCARACHGCECLGAMCARASQHERVPRQVGAGRYAPAAGLAEASPRAATFILLRARSPLSAPSSSFPCAHVT